MIKTILVPATGSDRDGAVFASALAVARAFAAHLEFLHVRPDAAATAVAMASDGGGATMVGGLIDRLEEEASQREEKAKQLFDGFCQREGLALRDAPPGAEGPSAQWLRETGAEPYWVAEHGRAADLLVIGRPGKDARCCSPPRHHWPLCPIPLPSPGSRRHKLPERLPERRPFWTSRSRS